MKLGLLGLPILLAAALVACGGTDQNTTNSGGSGTGASTGTGGGNTGGTTTGGGDTGGGNTGGGNVGGGGTGGGNTGGGGTGGGNTGGAGGGSTGGSGGAGGSTMFGGSCGGIAGMPCDVSQYCNFDDDKCGGDDSPGTCTDKPGPCPDVYDPVCACDGQAYGNACEAAAAGVDLSLLAACPTPDFTFPCGPLFCEVGQELCQIQLSDVADEPDSYKCDPLPPNCAVDGATCACLADVACSESCVLENGGFTLTCPGG